MNELKRMQQEINEANANRGQQRPPPRPTDSDGYEQSASPPESFVENMKGRIREEVEQKEDGTLILALPVQEINLRQRKIFGSIGTFDLTEEDVQAFTLLATDAMRRAIDAICAAPERSAPKPNTSVRGRPKKAVSSAPSTKGLSKPKRGRPAKKGGVAPSQVSPST